VSGLYEQLAANDRGRMELASARLRYEVLGVLHKALEVSGMSQSDLARRLNLRRSAVNQVFRGDGNVRISTLAEYLYAMGFELDLRLVQAGEPRRAALEGRQPRPAFSAITTTTDVPIMWHRSVNLLVDPDFPRYPFEVRKLQLYIAYTRDSIEEHGPFHGLKWIPSVATRDYWGEFGDTSTAVSFRPMVGSHDNG
jgi:transcriptional regulator with XRE-family HTH domain